MAKGGKARERYLAKVRYNQQVAQVNQLYKAKLASGMTRGQAATSQAGDTELAQSLGLPGYRPGQSRGGDYVVKDGDSLSKIAENVGTTPDAILASNPDLTSPKTGMVISAPNINPSYMQYSQQAPPTVPNAVPTQQTLSATNEKRRNIGGLPSNAALGSLTNNPQGVNPGGIQAQGFGTGGTNAYNPVTGRNEFMTAQNNPFNQPFVNSNGIANPQNTPDALWSQNEQRRISSNSYLSQQPEKVTNIPVQTTRPNATLPNNINIQNQFRQVIENGMIPTQDMLDWGTRAGLLQKMAASTTPSFSGGGGGFWGRGGGGGGGRGSGGGGYSGGYQNSNSPAFGSASGFRGLINWRL